MEFLIGSTLAIDLDLQVFDKTYTIKIRRWSGTDNVWFGIAWTVTGGLPWADVTRVTVLDEALSVRGRQARRGR